MQTENPQLTQEQAEAQAALDWQWLLGDPRGQRIARTILRWSQCDATGPIDGIERMAVATGARMVGNLLKAQLRKHAEELWVRLEADYTRELNQHARAEAEREKRLRDAAPKEPTP